MDNPSIVGFPQIEGLAMVIELFDHAKKGLGRAANRTFSYSGKEFKSNDIMMQFEEFSNVHNCDRTSNATR